MLHALYPGLACSPHGAKRNAGRPPRISLRSSGLRACALRGNERSLILLKPGATIGILGGGQLARMLALAAAPLGLRCHVYSPEKNSCAFDVVHAATCAEYEDEASLGRFRRAPSMSSPMNSRTCRPRPPPFSPGAGRSCRTRRCWKPRKTGSPKRISSAR